MHLESPQEALEVAGNEGRTVICFHDPGGAVAQEQGGQLVHHHLGRVGAHRAPEQLPATGQVAHGEQVVELAIDGRGRLGEVHGPDGAGAQPAQLVARAGVLGLPQVAIAALELGQLAARHVGE